MLVSVLRPFDLVIFDCDGVLVDSERDGVRTEAMILSGLGWPLTEADMVERLAGILQLDTCNRRSNATFAGEYDWNIECEPRYREVF